MVVGDEEAPTGGGMEDVVVQVGSPTREMNASSSLWPIEVGSAPDCLANEKAEARYFRSPDIVMHSLF